MDESENITAKYGDDFKDILIVAGVISLIGLFLPSGINYISIGGSSLTELFWMAGLFIYTLNTPIGSNTEIIFFNDGELLFPGWISLILILIGSILSISTALKIKRGELNSIKTKLRTSISLGLFLWGGVLYLVGMESAWTILTFNHFWGEAAVPFLGLFTPFLSGIIAIYVLTKIFKD